MENSTIVEICQVAVEHSLDPDVAVAVMAVEAGNSGFHKGRLIVRFEPRVWVLMQCPLDKRETAKLLVSYGHSPSDDRVSLGGQWVSFHGNQDLEWLTLDLAQVVHANSALKSASYGIAQIMGFNHALVGYGSVEGMVAEFEISESAQINAFFTYCQNRRDGSGVSALSHLQTGDYYQFATLYNGVGQQEYYANRIRQELARRKG